MCEFSVNIFQKNHKINTLLSEMFYVCCEIHEINLTLFLDGIHIRRKGDKTSETSSEKGIQMGHSPATSPAIWTRLRLKILWSGWPAPNKQGELKSNIYTITVYTVKQLQALRKKSLG